MRSSREGLKKLAGLVGMAALVTAAGWGLAPGTAYADHGDDHGCHDGCFFDPDDFDHHDFFDHHGFFEHHDRFFDHFFDGFFDGR